MTLDKQGRKRIIFWVIIGCAVFMRVIAFLNSDNFHGIAAGKILESMRLIKYSDNIYSWIVPAHGPLHIYFLALAIKIFNNPVITAKLVSFLAGVMFLFAYFKAIKLCFDKEIALMSLFVAGFFPLLIIHSALSTSESCFLLFLFSGLFFFLKYRSLGGDKNLLVSAVLFGFSSMCRFEGGLFIFFVSLTLVEKRKRFFLFICVASILPVVWMVFNQLLFGDFLYFLHSSDTVVRYEYNCLHSYGKENNFFTKLFYWPLCFKNYFGWIIFLLGISGLIFNGIKKEYRFMFLLLLSILAVFILKTFNEELALQPRYGMSLGLLFVPFSAVLFRDLLERIKKKNYRRLVLTLFLLQIIFHSAYFSLINMPVAPFWVKDAAFFLFTKLKGDGESAVFVDADENNFKEPFKVYSGLDVDRFVDYEGEGGHIELLMPRNRNRLKYIVLISPQKELTKYSEIYRRGDCKIYEIKKNEK